MRGRDPSFDRDETCHWCQHDASVCDCPDVVVRPFKKAGEPTTVHLSYLKRFGHWHRHCDNAVRTLAEMRDTGEIVLALHKDQSAAALKIIREHVKRITYPPGGYRTVRECGEMLLWEPDALTDDLVAGGK